MNHLEKTLQQVTLRYLTKDIFIPKNAVYFGMEVTCLDQTFDYGKTFCVDYFDGDAFKLFEKGGDSKNRARGLIFLLMRDTKQLGRYSPDIEDGAKELGYFFLSIHDHKETVSNCPETLDHLRTILFRLHQAKLQQSQHAVALAW